jgi:hypothetical protein
MLKALKAISVRPCFYLLAGADWSQRKKESARLLVRLLVEVKRHLNGKLEEN